MLFRSSLRRDCEPIKNVPQSLRNDGQNVISEVPVESYYKVTVEKVV